MEIEEPVSEFPYEEVVTNQIKTFGLTRLMFDTNQTICQPDFIPSVADYLSAINVYGVTLFTLGGAAVLLVLIIYIDTLRHVMKNSPGVKTYSAFVLGVYPVVATASYCAMVVPRAHLLAEAVTQGIFMVGIYQLFCLFLAYCGGEAELIKKVKPNSLDTRVGPCCCWPCCCCLPTFTVNKNNLKFLRLLVLQLPLVQGLVYMSLCVMWADKESLYQVNYLYVQPLIIFSLICGIWGMSMTLRMLRDLLKDHAVFAKFMVLQMVLFFAKLQGQTTRSIARAGLLPCKPPISPMVYGNLIQSSLMLIEMVILGLIARKLYKKELPISMENNNNIEQICVISTHISTIENIMKGAIQCEPVASKYKKTFF